MAFHNNPSVDDNSKLSEKSVTKTKEFFCRDNNFISREEFPDYGVDLDVELIDSNNEASGNKFAIQIKSSGSTSIITKNEKKYISLTFSTSRLGYLSRRKPGLGLIVFYDNLTSNLYYEYVEDIIQAITIDRNDENWKEQHSVNIHIPLLNVLTIDSCNNIYEKINLRFKNHRLLLRTHGADFDLPVFDDYNQSEEFTSLELAESHGPFLVNNRKFRELAYLIDRIPRRQLLANTQLMVISALTYAELGDLVEAKYLLSKLKLLRSEFSKIDLQLFSLIEPKIKFSSGDIDLVGLKDMLQAINPEDLDDTNKISLLGQLIQLEAIDLASKKEYSVEFEEELLNFYTVISAAAVDEISRISFYVIHSEVVTTYSNSFYVTTLLSFKLKYKIGLDVNDFQKDTLFLRYKRMSGVCGHYITIAEEYSKKEGNSLLRAEVQLVKCQKFLKFRIGAYAIELELDEDDAAFYKFHFHFNLLIDSHNIFMQHDRYVEAHLSLCYALELKKLSILAYNKYIPGEGINELEGRIQSIITAKGIKNYISEVDKLLSPEQIERTSSEVERIINLTDNQMDSWARQLAISYDLPLERYKNIKKSMLDTKLFYKLRGD